MPSDTLAARLLAAPAGSRALDAEIAKAAGYFKPYIDEEGFYISSVTLTRFDQVDVLTKGPNGGGIQDTRDLPPFTTSLDAITALIEARGYPDHSYSKIGSVAYGAVKVSGYEAGITSPKCATPALALCCALAAAENW